MLSLSDDDAIFDQADFVVKEAKDGQSSKTEIEIIKMYNIVQENMKAYSFEWPYVSFSGLKNNYIFLLNAFDNTIIHRIQIEDD